MYSPEILSNPRRESILNKPVDPDDGALSVVAISAWLIAEVAELLSVAARDLAVDKPLANYGLSSMTGVILSGDLEEWLGIQLDPAVAWEYPTIESLASYLAEQLRR